MVGKVGRIEKGTTVVWPSSPLTTPMGSIGIATQEGKGAGAP